jgi:tetratricopeptide (TPR) repeat protein
LVLGLFALLSALSAPAAAENDAARETARQLAYAGARAQAEGRFGEASQYFERGYMLMPVPTLGLGWARALVSLGKLLEARERLLEISQSPLSERQAAADRLDLEVQRRAQRDAGQELGLLEPRIPTLEIALDGPSREGVGFSIDGAPRSLPAPGERVPLNPGHHRILAARGGDRSMLDVELAESEHRVVQLHLSPPPMVEEQGWTSMRWAGVGAAATGVVGLGVASYFFARTLDQKHAAEARCDASAGAPVPCDPRRTSEYHAAYDSGNWATAFAIGGTALIATGATLFFLGEREAPPSEVPVQVGLDLGPGGWGARLSGTF